MRGGSPWTGLSTTDAVPVRGGRPRNPLDKMAEAQSVVSYQNADPAVYRNADQRTTDATGLPPVRSSDAAI